MDLGYFKRSRLTFACWVAAPALVVAAVHSTAYRITRAAHEDLSHRNAYLSLLPLMDQSLDQAGRILEGFAIEASDGNGYADALTSSLQQTAQDADFTINSLSVDEKPQAPAPESASGNVTGYRVVIKGDGSLVSVVDFLRTVYNHHQLMVVESIRLTTMGSLAEFRYRGEFRLAFYQVPRPDTFATFPFIKEIGHES